MQDTSTLATRIRVALVDDHRILTDALTLAIGSEPGMQVIGTANSCTNGRELLSHTCPDVLLLDVILPDGDGLSLIPEIRTLCPQAHILVLTSFADEKTLLRALDFGINGFLAKSRPLSEIMLGIRQAVDGEIVMPTSLLLSLLAYTPQSRASSQARQEYEQLTPREKEILTLLAQGKSGAAIADELNIAPLTVRTHIRNLLDKLGVHSRLEAVTYALHNGLIEPPI